jgi:hypothetical protein
MNNQGLEKIKTDLLNDHWTETLHYGLKELSKGNAKAIVESFDKDDINRKVNSRKFQEDYIADYLEFLWGISEDSFWNHISEMFTHEIELLWSDNMFYYEILCNEKIPTNIFQIIVTYIGYCNEKDQDFELLTDIIKSQIDNFKRQNEINNIISSFPKNIQYIIKRKVEIMINSNYTYK